MKNETNHRRGRPLCRPVFNAMQIMIILLIPWASSDEEAVRRTEGEKNTFAVFRAIRVSPLQFCGFRADNIRPYRKINC